MSKASEWVERHTKALAEIRAAQDAQPVYQLRLGGVTVQSNGSVKVRIEYDDLSAEELLGLANWIIDTFGEPVQYCFRCALVLPRGPKKRVCPRSVNGNTCEPRTSPEGRP